MRKSFLQIAKSEAKKSQHQFLVGAVLTIGSRVISKGHNKPDKTHKIAYWNHEVPEFATTHAEIDALVNVSKKVSQRCNLYVVRLLRSNHKIANAKPCEMCMTVIKDMGVKKVFYTIAESHFGMIDLRDLRNHERKT